MTKVLKFLGKIVTPFSLGCFFSIFFAYFVLTYYVDPKLRDNSDFYEGLQTLHNLSTDSRLKFRGPRRGDASVAILTVDDRAIEKYGRWPWPRTKIAKIIDKAMEHGAKTIAFDIIFSEKQDAVLNSLATITPDLKKKWPQNHNVIDQVIGDLKDRNSHDKAFSTSVEEHGEQLILGAVYNEYTPDAVPNSPYPDYCLVAIDKKRGYFEYWEDEALEIGVSDVSEKIFPSQWEELLLKHFQVLSENVTGKWLAESPSKLASYFQQSGVDSSNSEIIQLTQNFLTDNREDFDETLEALPPQKQQLLSWASLKAHSPASSSVDVVNEMTRQQKIYCENRFLTDDDELLEVVKANWDTIRKDSSYEDASADEAYQSLVNEALTNPVARASSWLLNIPEVRENKVHSGSFNAIQDKDGSIRRARLFVRSYNQFMPHLSLKSYLVAKGLYASVELSPNQRDPGEKFVEKVIIKDGEDNLIMNIPVDGEGHIPINYAGPQKMFAYLSAGELLDDDEEMIVEQTVEKNGKWIEEKIKVNRGEFLKDKNFIFGSTAMAVYDLRVTPFEENFPGVETHANLLDNIIRKDFFHTSEQENIIMPLFILFVGFLFSFLISKLGAVSGLALTAFTFLSILVVDFHVFFKKGVVVNVIFPLIFVSTIYTFLTFFKYFTEERKKKELKGTFQKYVSPAIVNEILKDPSKLELGGIKQEMSVFFSDVRGFTTISERLDPQALSDLLNAYLTPMTELIFECNGTLDKYMGDAIMGFFGAPIPSEKHAANACRSALLQMAKLEELQKEWAAEGLPLIDVGIGINTGDMSVGNMGSKTVRSYTVMGDAVNLGARLEGINKQYGTHIIISEFTQKHIESDSFVTREIDWVRVKGKNEPVRIFELIKEGAPDSDLAQRLKSFNTGFDLYHQMRFEDAISQFNASLSVDANDEVSKLYIERCTNYIKTPPAEGWDGVFVMTTK